MGLYSFLNSYSGMWVVQSVMHSLLAMIIISLAVRAWRIETPLVKQRFYFLVVLAPTVSYQLFQAVDPDRGSVGFRSGALFDSMRWLNLELMGAVPFGSLLVLVLVLTSVVFLFQELLPVLKQTFSRRMPELEYAVSVPDPRIKEAMEGLPGEKPEVHVLSEDELLLFSRVGRSPAIFLSTGLLNGLAPDELRAALAHEMAHIKRARRPTLVLIFVLRVLMFFNPVILLEFRRIVQEEEKICDDRSTLITGNPQALAKTLSRFHYPAEDAPKGLSRITAIGGMLEKYSHNFLIDSRIKRLSGLPDGRAAGKPERHFFKLFLTFLAILSLSYFVV